MHAYDITGGPGLGRLIQSLTRYSRIGGSERWHNAVFTIPVRCEGGGGGWIWDGGSDQVSVRISSLERIDPLPGEDSRSDDWRFAGIIDSLYDGLDGTKVRGVYSTSTRTGSLERIADAQTAP